MKKGLITFETKIVILIFFLSNDAELLMLVFIEAGGYRSREYLLKVLSLDTVISSLFE